MVRYSYRHYKAITLKMDCGAVASKAEIARHFGIKPPSIHDWIKKGSISKDKLPELWRYFSDVVGPEHWGISSFPSDSPMETTLGPAIQTPSVSTPVARLIQRLTEMEAAGQLTPPLLRALETLLEAVAPRRTSQKLLAAQALLSTQQILQGNSPHENPPPDPAQEHTPSAE